MVAMTVELRNVEGTEAAMGWAGGHTIVVDRPEGKAGGKGLGFNGGQLLGLAIGGCFCNDLRYVAHAQNVVIESLSVSVTVELGGDPFIATAAHVTVECILQDGSDPKPIIDKARADSTVSNSLAAGVPVSFRTSPRP